MRTSIPKDAREKVRSKFGGRCAYCGTTLGSRFHVDHVVPVARGGLTQYENLYPACPQCNNFKMSWSLDDFRRNLEAQVERARKYSVNFRNAERFGKIKVIDGPIVFHFEAPL